MPYLPYLPYPVKTDTYRCIIDALLNNISALLNFYIKKYKKYFFYYLFK
uniref:Uncharacterized protein n=1 Tax=Podoviridae sp. ctc5632 TaxID=2826565 RepID=A0A8S5LVR6_9CAUD|nr:MAG TPA: hypothetical protein [Podoviridae sp. ctc5632]